MQVKVFESSDMATGLKMVKEELGPDALILSTKTIRSGKLGLLGKNRFEITAAIDSIWPDKTQPPLSRPQAAQGDMMERDMLLAGNETTAPEPPLTYNAAMQVDRSSPKAAPEAAFEKAPAVPTQNTQSKLQSEVDELKGMIRNLGQEMLRINTSRPVTLSNGSSDNSSLQSLQDRLLDYGISAETAKTISDFAKESLTFDELSDPFGQQEFVQNTIRDLLHVTPDIFKEDKRQHRIALVGPTGVGKTTTLAKIAANYLAKHSASIGFITIDTYRIAAVEQLKVYGDIMNIPVEVVLSPEQLEHALLKLRDKDLVLIDTAGRSPKDNFCIEELFAFLRPDFSIEKHLVLSATTRENELFDAIQRFSVLGLDNSIITKIDECTSLGLLLDIQIREKLPFSFVTNGQRVPEDIMEADKETLTQLIMSPGKGLPYE